MITLLYICIRVKIIEDVRQFFSIVSHTWTHNHLLECKINNTRQKMISTQSVRILLPELIKQLNLNFPTVEKHFLHNSIIFKVITQEIIILM